MNANAFSRRHVLARTQSVRVRDPNRLSNRDGEASPRRPTFVSSGLTSYEQPASEPVDNTVLNDYLSKHASDALPALKSIIGTFHFEEDSEDNIQFNTMDSTTTVKAATISKLVEKIIKDSNDELYEIFFATYTSFISPDDLLTLLLSMYQPPQDIQLELSGTENVNVSLSPLITGLSDINENILGCLVYWITNYHYEIPSSVKCRLILFLREHQDEALEQAVMKICEEKEDIEVTLPLAMEWDDYLNTLPPRETEEEEEEDVEEGEEGEDEEVTILDENDDKPIIPEGWDGQTFDFLQWSPKEIAVSGNNSNF
jgi:hypothetical protein